MLRTFLLFFYSISLMALWSCQHGKFKGTSQNDPIAIHDTVIVLTETKTPVDTICLTYSRTPCFGMCPVFELTVTKSGAAIFNGKNFTDRIGKYQSQWSETVLQRIQFLADSIGYFSFDEKYDNDHVTDLPSIHTSLLRNGQMKAVSNRYKGPKELHILYKELDALIEKSAWKPSGNSSN